MSGWSWYDRRNGVRVTGGEFLDRESAEERLAYWLERSDELSDALADQLSYVDVREVADETRSAKERSKGRHPSRGARP